MAACSAVVKGVLTGLCRGLVSNDCHGTRLSTQQQRLRIYPQSSATSQQLGSSTFAGLRWGCSQAELSASSMCLLPPHGVAGVQAGTSDEVAGNRTGIMTIGQVTIQGPREEMEDDAVVQDGPLGFTYAAVFDGHAGFSSTVFLRDALYKECVESFEGGTVLVSGDENAVQEAFVRAFQRTDGKLLSWLESRSEDKESGATATIMFLSKDYVTIAHVGDSRAVLSRMGTAVDLSSDHRPFGNNKTSIQEVNRVRNAGGWVSHGRLCGTLSVSRAFGDPSFKTGKKEMLEQGIKDRMFTRPFAERLNVDGIWLSATPDVSHVKLGEDVEFIILATDGLWDSFKSNDAVRFVRKQLKEHGNVQLAAEAIAQATLEKNGQDNITIVIIDLGKALEGDGPGLKLKLW